MEKLPFLKNHRKSRELTPPSWGVYLFTLIFFCLLAMGTGYTSAELDAKYSAIERAPFDPKAPSPLALIPFHPDRELLTDPFTQTQAIANRLDRSVQQYRKLTQAPDLLLLPMMSEPEDFKANPVKELSLWSLKIAPYHYTDGFYSIDALGLGLENFTMRNDLVKIPPSPYGRWSKLSPNRLFLGSNPASPSDGQYQIDYYAYVIPKVIILGKINNQGRITPYQVFLDNPKEKDPREQLLSQIQRLQGGIFSLNLLIATIVGLIAIRELTTPKDSRELFLRTAQICHYDVFLAPIVLLVPQTQRGATLFCLALICYLTFKVFLRRSLALIERERINLYR